ncbi:MAG: NosD domain-containing protein [Candidatus Methanomethylophilaceae archaeon]
MNRKISGILITIALVLSLCLTSSLNVMAAATWYVDDSNAGAEDGTQAHPYNTITEAVNAASAGDTIIVAGGTYAETVAVGKTLEIRAKSGETATVNPGAGNEGFIITANGVTIHGFTITEAGIGTFLNGASSCTITNNSLVDCSIHSIALFNEANTNVILGNTCTGNAGIYNLYIVYCYGNIVANNTCTGDGNGYGIFVYNSDENTVAGNNCSGFRCGIYIEKSKDNIVTANTCSQNSHYGIFLAAVDAVDLNSCNSFMYNTLDDNGCGMYISDVNINAPLVYFKNNNITNNTTGVHNNDTQTLNATYNYWEGNTTDIVGNVDTDPDLAAPVTNTMPEAAVVTTSITTSTSTATSITTDSTVVTATEIEIGTQVLTLIETSTSIVTETDTVTLLNPTTLTETRSVTSTDTQISTTIQQLTSTDTQSLTYTVTVPQTFTDTATMTLTATEDGVDVPLVIIIAVAGLLAGGLIVTIIIRRV